MPQSPTYGYDKLKDVYSKIKSGTSPQKKSFDEMSLEELERLEIKYLNWYPTAKNEDDKAYYSHLYNNYIKPKIAEFEALQRSAEDNLFKV